MGARRHRGRNTAVQEVLKAVYVSGADENRVGSPVFGLFNKDCAGSPSRLTSDVVRPAARNFSANTVFPA